MSKENDFYAGHFSKIIQVASDLAPNEMIYLIGSYCFQGKPEEAERVLSTMKLVDLRAYFFLGIGWTRLSQYQKARTYFTKLQQEGRSSFDHFLLAQGMGFYNYFICRYKPAADWIKKARVHLQKDSHHRFWDLLFLDLSSNILVRRGQINLGIEHSRQALKVAREISNRFSEEAVEVSLIIFESLYGLNQKESLSQLKKMIEKYKTRSSFYYFNLSLEYIRRLNLNGDFQEAEKNLRSIEKSIFTSALKRQQAVWTFRWAHLLFLQGKSEQSLNQLDSALEYLKEKQDASIQLQLLGLKLKIYTLNKKEDPRLIESVKKLTFYCQDSQSLSYAYRLGWTNKPVTEDPYAQFFHSWKRRGHQNYQSMKRVMEKGWSSLFVDLVPTERNQFIYLDFLPKQALFFSEKGIFVLDGLTALIRQSLLVLSKGSISKKDFVEMIWGYSYEAFRHDTLIYTLVSRLRSFLGEHQDLLLMKDHTIELRQTQVRVYEHETATPEMLEIQSALAKEQVNFRQIELLQYLEQNKFIDIGTASKILHTTRITAFRDLDGLVGLNRICRLGQGRATRYALLKTENGD